MGIFSRRGIKQRRRDIGREIAEIKKLKQSKAGLERGMMRLEREKEDLRRQKQFLASRSPARKISSVGTGFAKGFVRGRKRQLVFARDVRRPIIGSGIRRGTGKRGRPAGSFDPRYRAYGGVYGYRKVLNAQLRQQRLQALRDNAISPQQQTILAQIEARRRSEQMSPENRTIPDTRGSVPLRSLNQEIDDAANLVP